MLAQTFCSVFSLSIVLRKNFRMRNFHSWEFYNFSNISSRKRKSKQRPGLCCQLALGESWNGGRLVLESLTPQNVSGCSEPLQQKQQLRFPRCLVHLFSVKTRGRKGSLCSSVAHRPRICLAWKFHIWGSEGEKPYTPVFRILLCPYSCTSV